MSRFPTRSLKFQGSSKTFFAKNEQLRLTQTHLRNDILFFATDQSPPECIVFTLNIAKLNMLEKYSELGSLSWHNFEERIEWTQASPHSPVVEFFLDIELSSCDFAWMNGKQPLELLAYVIFRPVRRGDNIKVWAFEASFDLERTTGENIVFRSRTGLIQSPFFTLDTSLDGGETVSQSSLGLFRGRWAPPAQGGLRKVDETLAHVGLDDDGNVYFKRRVRPTEEWADRAVYLADIYSGAVVYRTHSGINIVYP